MSEVRTDADDLIAESRDAIDVLTRLAHRLKVFTERLEQELDLRERNGGLNGEG